MGGIWDVAVSIFIVIIMVREWAVSIFIVIIMGRIWKWAVPIFWPMLANIAVPNIVNGEKVNWVRQHELIYNRELRKEQLALLANFGQKLKTCYRDNSEFGILSTNTGTLVFRIQE